MPELTRRQRRLLKKQEREQQLSKEQRRGHFHGKHVLGLIILVGLIGVGVYGVSRLGTTAPNSPPAQTYTPGPVHWHGVFEVELCGKKQDFSGYGAVSHVGSPLLHTHGDGLIHMEGRVIAKEDIALGKFFDGINVPFDRDRIMDKKNGDECPAQGSSPSAPGKPGQVKMFVNGAPNTEFRDFVGKYTEKGEDTQIRIVFE